MYYSQFEEDHFIVKYCERYGIKLYPVAIEIGASDGITSSNIRHFCTEKGFKGIYVEPHPERFKELERNITGQNTKAIRAACVSYEDTEFKTIGFKLEPCPDFSHIDPSSKFHVPIICWNDLIISEHIIKIGILSIDVEGEEMNILMDIVVSKIRPEFIIIESNSTYERIRQMEQLISYGYILHKMKDKNMLWMDEGLMTPEQDNAIYDIR